MVSSNFYFIIIIIYFYHFLHIIRSLKKVNCFRFHHFFFFHSHFRVPVSIFLPFQLFPLVSFILSSRRKGLHTKMNISDTTRPIGLIFNTKYCNHKSHLHTKPQVDISIFPRMSVFTKIVNEKQKNCYISKAMH